MIRYLKGNIFDSGAQVLVNPINTVGVMGKGLALDFKQRYPRMFDLYRDACRAGLLHVGEPMLYRSSEQWVLLFPTKAHWKEPSRLEWIETGLQKFVERYKSKGITSIAFPKLGCGNGGLNWMEVKEVMERYLGELPIEVYVYMD